MSDYYEIRCRLCGGTGFDGKCPACKGCKTNTIRNNASACEQCGGCGVVMGTERGNYRNSDNIPYCSMCYGTGFE